MLLALRAAHPLLWRYLSADHKFVDSCFELYGDFLNPIPAHAPDSSWQCRLRLTEVLYLLFLERHSSPRLTPFILRLTDIEIEWAVIAPLETALTFLRHTISLFTIIEGNACKDDIPPRVARLLHALHDRDSPLFAIALRFALQMHPIMFTPNSAIRLLSSHPVRSLSDIEIVSSLADRQTVLSALAFLTTSALASKIWHRACMEKIRVLLLEFGSRADVHDVFTRFVHRVFAFVAQSAKRNSRPSGRALLICESLSALLAARIGWLDPCIMAAAKSIAASNASPQYLSSFFPLPLQIEQSAEREPSPERDPRNGTERRGPGDR
jgi:hypothetical protein